MSIDLSYIKEPLSKADLKAELGKARKIRNTNKLDNEIYIFNHHSSPKLMQEIGRLRELTFASAGGGTGQPVDIDNQDTSEYCYDQLIVYSPEDEEIVGGYRFIDCAKVAKNKLYLDHLSTSHYFNCTDEFVANYLPYTIELGRSWIQPNYQPSNNPRKGLFALDNLWDGLGALVVLHDELKYFYGKVTMYPSYDVEARNALLTFMHHFFPDNESLVTPKIPLEFDSDNEKFKSLIDGLTYKDAHRLLGRFIKGRGEFIPPLINQYMSLSSTMKTFGTCINKDFGNVEETGILVTINDIYPEKSERHLKY